MLTRRGFFGLGMPQDRLARPEIHQRADWAGSERRAKGPLVSEDDPKFLLIHHSETATPTRPAQVRSSIRGFYAYHTSSAKGWADVAYNFLIDPFGGIWEGRTGSLAGPVRGDATGGSQGHAELCCFIGSYDKTPPPAVALNAAAALLAWLAVRDGIDLNAGRTITFVSRGSNRWPRGAMVTTWPMAGHREMSQTSCPGDALFPLVRKVLLPLAQEIVAAAPTPSPSPTPVVAPNGTSPAATPGAGPAPFVVPLGIAAGAAGLATVGGWYLRRRRR
jgi:hypothetical protein